MINNDSVENYLDNAQKYVLDKIKKFKPEIGLILGSGLGFFAEQLQNAQKINYNDIPGFTKSTVEGHQGKLIFGKIHNKNILAMQGRIHFYETHNMRQVTFPIKLMKRLGVKSIVVTNAAGGINTDFKPGDLMLIKDHINFMGTHPCIGKKSEDAKERFFDMTEAYDIEYREMIKKLAKELGIDFKEGVYFANTGPSYETPAEVRMIKILGGDAVGMSTVPEVLVARELGMRVCGISCITNMAAGVSKNKLSHKEVTETANRVKSIFVKLIENIIKNM